jgi:hypothetical protein
MKQTILPCDVAMAYPVLPRYASGQFHLDADMLDDADLLMKTYANGKFVSSKLNRKLGIVYPRKVETYLCRSMTRGFISYDAFTGSVTSSAAASIRFSFFDVENSTLTAYVEQTLLYKFVVDQTRLLSYIMSTSVLLTLFTSLLLCICSLKP